jgi:hypothetical protein
LSPLFCPQVIVKFPLLVGVPVLAMWAINFYFLHFLVNGIRDLIRERINR